MMSAKLSIVTGVFLSFATLTAYPITPPIARCWYKGARVYEGFGFISDDGCKTCHCTHVGIVCKQDRIRGCTHTDGTFIRTGDGYFPDPNTVCKCPENSFGLRGDVALCAPTTIKTVSKESMERIVNGTSWCHFVNFQIKTDNKIDFNLSV